MMNKKQTSGFASKCPFFALLLAILLFADNVRATDKIAIFSEMSSFNLTLDNLQGRVKPPVPAKNADVKQGDSTKVAPPDQVKESEKEYKIAATDSVYLAVEQMPSFPGGDEALVKFLGENIKYPKEAMEMGIEGTVLIQFVVGKKGKVTNARVIRSLDPLCDQEAVRVIKKMPKWTPGKAKGKAVSVYYTIPIRFRLT